MDAKLFGEIFFWSFLACGILAASSSWLCRGKLARWGGAPGLAAGAALIAAICFQTGRPPLSGALESLGGMALVLAVLAQFSHYGRGASQRLAAMAWAAAVLLLVILAWLPRQVNPDWFLYRNGWTRSFFLCRQAAMAILFYASLAALSWRRGDREGQERRPLEARARSFLLLGTALFLLGEVSGFYWCLTWRGDYWLWNRNFLESTMIFLLASASLHLPARLAADPRALRLAFGLPGGLAMAAYLVHQITEALL